MPKQKKADDKSYRKNPTPKATRRSERTRANVERRKQTRQSRLLKAAERRASQSYTFPLNAVIPVSELSKKAQEDYPSLTDGEGHPIIVPHPYRGMKSKKGSVVFQEAMERRERTAVQIARKQGTRLRLREAKQAGGKKAQNTRKGRA